MPISASPRATSGTMTDSPAVGCTSALMPALSLATLAIAVPVVWFSEPGCMVATPIACAEAAPAVRTSAPIAAKALRIVDGRRVKAMVMRFPPVCTIIAQVGRRGETRVGRASGRQGGSTRKPSARSSVDRAPPTAAAHRAVAATPPNE